MTALDEVKRMQQQGLSEEEIIKNLRERGLPYKDITEAFSQSKIKVAVNQPQTDPESSFSTKSSRNNFPNQERPPQSYPSANENEMQQSIMQNPQANLSVPSPSPPGSKQKFSQEIESPSQSPGFEYPSQPSYPEYEPSYDYGGGYASEYGNYPEYDYSQQGSLSSDTVSEISEQIVSEKMSELRKHLEKISDFKTVVETKVESLDERLKRIEKIIDNLQSSILKKVGNYVTNVDDIKKELVATQKSFSKLVPELRKSSHKKTSSKKSHSKKKK